MPAPFTHYSFLTVGEARNWAEAHSWAATSPGSQATWFVLPDMGHPLRPRSRDRGGDRVDPEGRARQVVGDHVSRGASAATGCVADPAGRSAGDMCSSRDRDAGFRWPKSGGF